MNICRVACNKAAQECRRDVTVTIACRHQVTWKCGKGEDPRHLTPLECCRVCVGARWQDMQPPSEHDRALFEKAALHKMETELHGLNHEITSITTVATTHKAHSDRRLLAHIDARRRVLMKFVEYMKEPGVTLALPPSLLGKAEQLAPYDLVFRPCKLANRGNDDLLHATNWFCGGIETLYGYGYR